MLKKSAIFHKKALVRNVSRRLPTTLKNLYYKFQLSNWNKRGKPVPPPHIIKQKTINQYQKNHHCNTLVETGTYLGDMIFAQMNHFNNIYSIELDSALFKRATKTFKKHPHVTILQGDSGKVLKQIAPTLKEKSIFWLDGHYSGGITARGEKDCPIYEELEPIFASKINHVLLIDDARCFNGTCDYPTIDDLSKVILAKKPQSTIDVEDDIIRVVLA
jgi:hypothetical protein